MEVQLKVPFIRKTNRVGAGGHPIVDFQQNELPREDEDPQWIKVGPQFPSDCSGDDPESSEEYDPQKDKCEKRKRYVAKA